MPIKGFCSSGWNTDQNVLQRRMLNFKMKQTSILLNLILIHLIINLINVVRKKKSFSCILLTLNAPIATTVVCFSRLLKCLRTSLANSVDPDQTAPVLGPRCLLLYLIRK